MQCRVTTTITTTNNIVSMEIDGRPFLTTTTTTTKTMKTSFTTAAAPSSDGTPWVERYRPQTLDDVSHQIEVVSVLKNAVTSGRLPHLLLYGPPGSGKTSVALALCKQLWHPSQWKRRVLELNASDERGISVVREKIKQFASLSVGTGIIGHHNNETSTSSRSNTTNKKMTNPSSFFGGTTRTTTGKGSTGNKENASSNMETQDDDHDEKEEKKYPNPPFKVIILDEADTVTPDAQAALRRIIEAHSRITRFILICNYVTRIIEPLASRCAKFRFQALPPASMKDRLTCIAQAEGMMDSPLPLQDDQIDAILRVAGGDMRRAVTSLQSVHALLSGGDPSIVVVDETLIAELSGLPPDNVIDELYRTFRLPQFDDMERSVQDRIISNGYSVQAVLQKLLVKITTNNNGTSTTTTTTMNDGEHNDDDELDELGRARLAIRIAEAEYKMNEGADEYLQLMTVCGLAMQCLREARANK